jgi:hypothetical protein
LYAVFRRAKTTEATISGTTPPWCLMMSRMSSCPPRPVCWLHHAAASLRQG